MLTNITRGRLSTMKKFLFIMLLLALAGAAGISADVRTEPIDVIVALDKSLSMVEEIGAVVEYVNTYIIDQLLIPGDYFLVLAFYGRTEIPVAMRITGDADKQKAKQAVAALAANGRFTDIGNALDVLGAELAKLPEQNRRKHLLLITDQPLLLPGRQVHPRISTKHQDHPETGLENRNPGHRHPRRRRRAGGEPGRRLHGAVRSSDRPGVHREDPGLPVQRGAHGRPAVPAVQLPGPGPAAPGPDQPGARAGRDPGAVRHPPEH